MPNKENKSKKLNHPGMLDAVVAPYEYCADREVVLEAVIQYL